MARKLRASISVRDMQVAPPTLERRTIAPCLLGLAMTACAAEPLEPASPAAPETLVTVTDGAGRPVGGARVDWTAPGHPAFPCPADLEILRGYVHFGTETTDDRGRAWLDLRGAGEHQPYYRLQVLGPDGGQTLASIPDGASSKNVELLPTVDADVAFRCGGAPCGPLRVRLVIAREGTICRDRRQLERGEDLELARLPRGSLEIWARASQGTATEAVGRYQTELKSDLQADLELEILGGTRELVGRVRFRDGEPPGGRDYFTPVKLECANGLVRYATPDPASGEFRMEALPRDSCEVSASHSGSREGRWRSEVVEVVPGAKEPVELELEPASPE